MQGLSGNNEAVPVERSKIYTATGDVIAREQFKDPLLGQLLEDKYLIEEVIGWGGMSVVYRAKQVMVDRTVAIKTVKFRADERPDIWQRFQREIVTLSRLSHRNVVTVYDCVVGKDGQPYVVMDLIQGCTLDDVLVKFGRLPLKQLCSIATQVASAVDHAHRHNVIHRDLKPANIMILGDPSRLGDEEGNCEVKVVDFGLAKLGEDNHRLTQTGQLWGSPPYISPEQIKGGDLDHRCDIYSLGVVVYEMATGRDPFASDVVYEMLHQHLHNDPPPFSDICPDNPPPRELEAVVRKAMAKDPNARYQTMAEFKEDLEKALQMAEHRQNSPEAKGMAMRVPPSKASTGRLPSPQRPVTNPLRQASAASARQAPRSTLSAPTILYIALSGILFFAAGVLAMRGLPFGPHGTTTATVVSAGGKNDSQSEANAGKNGLLQNGRQGADRLSGHSGRGGYHSGHFAPHLITGEHSQARHPGVSAPPPHHLAASSSASSTSSTVNKSLPKASPLHVDQSKFQSLRDLKSPILRQECGDLPQH